MEEGGDADVTHVAWVICDGTGVVGGAHDTVGVSSVGNVGMMMIGEVSVGEFGRERGSVQCSVYSIVTLSQ